MFQQIIALTVIAFFVLRLVVQKRRKKIKINEFIFWFFFWIITAGAIINLKFIDKTVASLGFSSSGINVLLYIAIIILFYFIFKLRLKIEKQEKNITKIIREISLKK